MGGGQSYLIATTGNATLQGGRSAGAHGDAGWRFRRRVLSVYYGDNLLIGGSGANTLYGGSGNDTLWGGGNSYMLATTGNTTLPGRLLLDFARYFGWRFGR